jgi:zinc protease
MQITAEVAAGALFTFLFLYLFLCFPIPIGAQSNVNNVSSFRLANGLRVILAPVNDIEAICVMLYHLTGVRDDPPEIRGGSFLYQNLMLGATQNLDVYDRIYFIRQYGGISNRIVNYDYSIFYQVIQESEVGHALWLESERIRSLQLTNRNITIQKDNVYIRNYRQLNSNVDFRAMDWIKRKLFEATPYEIPIYGKLEEIRNFDIQSIKKLYDNFSNLSRIIIVIAGKYDLEELKKLLNKHFATLHSKPVRPRSRNIPPNTNVKHKYTYENWLIDNLSEPFILYGIHTPAKGSLDYIYFDLIRYYLVDERISELNEILNRNYGLDVTITHKHTNYYDCNALIIKISAKRRANLEKARILINRKLEALNKGKTHSLSSSTFKACKSLMEIDFLKNMTVLQKRSVFLAENYHLNGKLNTEEEYLNRIRKINIYDIHRIAQKYLGKDNLVNLFVYEKPKPK